MKQSVLKSLKEKLLIGMQPRFWTEEEKETAKELIDEEIERYKKMKKS